VTEVNYGKMDLYCSCGQAMNDHQAPDPNAYSVYSDELFEKISHARVFWLLFYHCNNGNYLL